MSEEVQFDAGKALVYAASIARPRLVGTAEHDKVAHELAAKYLLFPHAARVASLPFVKTVAAADRLLVKSLTATPIAETTATA